MVDDVGNMHKDAIWRRWKRVIGDGIKYAIQKTVDFMIYSFMGIPIPAVWGRFRWGMFFRGIKSKSFSCPLLYWGVISWLKIWKWTSIWSGSRLHSDLLRIIRLTVIWSCSRLHNDLLGNTKSTVSGRVQVLQCCELLSGDKREGAWIVGLWEGTWIIGLWEGTWMVGLLRDESLDSRAYGKEPGW